MSKCSCRWSLLTGNHDTFIGPNGPTKTLGGTKPGTNLMSKCNCRRCRNVVDARHAKAYVDAIGKSSQPDLLSAQA